MRCEVDPPPRCTEAFLESSAVDPLTPVKFKNNLRRNFALCGLAVVSCFSARGYDLTKDSNGIYVVSWPVGPVTMTVVLPTNPSLTDGNSLSSSTVAAMTAWNAQVSEVQFAPVISPGTLASGYIGNGVNEIAIDSTIDGDGFGTGVLAVTQSWRSGNRRTESDVVFNSAYTWDSFRGTQIGGKQDIQRVALHELGHVLGLNHPNQASPPQFLTAIMNSHISYSPPIDALQPDDIAGASALYGAPGILPANNAFGDPSRLISTGEQSL